MTGDFEARVNGSRMLEDIKRNIERLIALYETERQQRKSALESLALKDAEIDSYKKRIAELERQVDNLKLTGAFASPAGSNAEAKEKLKGMITSIDRCISLLEK